jgi:CubicO group peptidase (beta-lactamase class C family)
MVGGAPRTQRCEDIINPLQDNRCRRAFTGHLCRRRGALLGARASEAPETIRADPSRSALIDDFVAGKVSAGEPGLALAVIKAGTVVHRAAYGLADLGRRSRNTPRTLFHLASCGKQFTALGILMLVEEGRLALDDPIGRHLPRLAAFGPKVTLRRLLSHTSGIRDLYDEEGMAAVLSRSAHPTNRDIITTYAELGCPMCEGVMPGDRFQYSNSGYELLGSVIESVSGEPYGTFFRTRVFDPLGMRDTFSCPDPRTSDPRHAVGYRYDEVGRFVEAPPSEFDDVIGSGSFVSTVCDLCLYEQALASHALVKPAAMRAALRSALDNRYHRVGYGFGWFLRSYKGMPMAEHGGDWAGFYAHIRRFLRRPLSIYVLSNHPGIDPQAVANVATDAYR